MSRRLLDDERLEFDTGNEVYFLNTEPADRANFIFEDLLVESVKASSRHYQQNVWPQGVETGETISSIQIGQLSSIAD